LKRSNFAYCDDHERVYRQENTIFHPTINGIGLLISVRGQVHEVDSILDIKDNKNLGRNLSLENNEA